MHALFLGSSHYLQTPVSAMNNHDETLCQVKTGTDAVTYTYRSRTARSTTSLSSGTSS